MVLNVFHYKIMLSGVNQLTIFLDSREWKFSVTQGVKLSYLHGKKQTEMKRGDSWALPPKCHWVKCRPLFRGKTYPVKLSLVHLQSHSLDRQTERTRSSALFTTWFFVSLVPGKLDFFLHPSPIRVFHFFIVKNVFPFSAAWESERG